MNHDHVHEDNTGQPIERLQLWAQGNGGMGRFLDTKLSNEEWAILCEAQELDQQYGLDDHGMLRVYRDVINSILDRWSAEETTAILNDPEAMADLAEAEQDLSDGNTIDLSELPQSLEGLRQADVTSDSHASDINPDYVAVGVSRPLADEILTPENDPETAEAQQRFIGSGMAAKIDEWIEDGAPGVPRERPLRRVTEYDKSQATVVPLPPDSELL